MLLIGLGDVILVVPSWVPFPVTYPLGVMGTDPGLRGGSIPQELFCELIQASGGQWDCSHAVFSFPWAATPSSSVLSQLASKMKKAMCLDVGSTPAR